MKTELKIGQKLSGFTVKDIHELPEYRATGILATHDRTGCPVYHVLADDKDNLFAFSFRTLPSDSSGVAHILEHTVLCGSERFPVKDPFLQLLKGSMNTFLNAFTFPDKTVYPASSTVPQDLFNLFEVYGDAVFFPRLMPEMFRQEGHRLEFDADGILQRTGIVFNEMKGNYSTHDNVASDWCMRSLFPNTAYAFDSGGDPAVIPTLDYATFKEFHRRYYHPANTQVFLYGDIPTEEWLKRLEDSFLHRFDPLDIQVRVEDPAPFKAPVRLTKTCPASPEDEEGGKTSITLNWLLNDVADAETTLGMELLAEILIGSAASPLQRALVDSGLGEDLSGPTGLETELSRLVLSVGLRGTEAGREDAIERLILDTLKDVVKDGLDPELVEGTLRRFEFRSKEIKGGGPFGLRLMRRSLRAWLHGHAPQTSLVFDPVMKSIRASLADDPRFFEKLTERMLLGNLHRSMVTVVPDAGQNDREAAAERAELDARQAALSAADKAELKRQQEALERYQSTPDSPEALASIPFLTAADIPVKVPLIISEDRTLIVGAPGSIARGDGSAAASGQTVVPLKVHDLYTNGISYVDLAFDLEHLSIEELRWMPLFASVVPALGLPGLGYEATATQINLLTGGFSAFTETSLLARGSFDEPEDLSIKLFFRLRCLDTGIAPAMELIGRLINEADLDDTKRLQDLYLEMRNEYRAAVVPSGSSFAALRAERGLSPSETIEELWRGISQLDFLNGLDEGKGDGTISRAAAQRISAALKAIRERIIRRGGLSVNLTAQGGALSDCVEAARAWAETLPEREVDDQAFELAAGLDAEGRPVPRLEALTLPSKVAFVATALPGSLIGGARYSHESLLAHLLRTGHLWEHIRMKGGAYGASAGNDGMSGLFTFSSYRDPRITATLNVYRQALEHYATHEVDEGELLLAKIGSVAKEIRPLVPGEAGLVSFRRWLYGISDSLRQAKRDELLAATPADLAQAARELLVGMEKSCSALIAGPDMVDKEEGASPDFRPLRTPISV